MKLSIWLLVNVSIHVIGEWIGAGLLLLDLFLYVLQYVAKGLLQLVAIIKQSNELLDPPCVTIRACDFIAEGEGRVTSYILAMVNKESLV